MEIKVCVLFGAVCITDMQQKHCLRSRLHCRFNPSLFTAGFLTGTTKLTVMEVHISASSYKLTMITIFNTSLLQEPAVFYVANTVCSCD